MGRFLAFYIPSAAEVAAFRRTGVPTEDETAFLRIDPPEGHRRHGVHPASGGDAEAGDLVALGLTA